MDFARTNKLKEQWGINFFLLHNYAQCKLFKSTIKKKSQEMSVLVWEISKRHGIKLDYSGL